VAARFAAKPPTTGGGNNPDAHLSSTQRPFLQVTPCFSEIARLTLAVTELLVVLERIFNRFFFLLANRGFACPTFFPPKIFVACKTVSVKAQSIIGGRTLKE